MPLLVEAPAAVPEVQRNDLAHLQLEIARRADQLAGSIVSDRHRDIAFWLQAEEEVFARHERARRKATDR